MSDKIGVIGAMEVEVQLLRQELDGCTIVAHAGMEFNEGTLNGQAVVVARCGIGKVNAALCTQIMVDLYGVTHVVNTGIAGSLDARIDIGDLVVSTDAVHHDVDASVFGYAPGQVPDLGTFAFASDASLRAAVVAAAAKAAPGVGVHEGRVVSGDQFIASDEVKARLAGEFGGLRCEMEGASIAQACWLNGVPFVVVRAISDKADGSAEMAYPEFEELAAHRCAAIVELMLADWSQR